MLNKFQMIDDSLIGIEESTNVMTIKMPWGPWYRSFCDPSSSITLSMDVLLYITNRIIG